MNKKQLLPIVIIVCGLCITSIFLGVYLPKKLNNIDISFTPKDLKSYPGQIAWLLAEIRLDIDVASKPLVLSIHTAPAIELEYTYWLTTQHLKLVEIFLHPNISHLNCSIELTLNASCGNMRTTANTSIEIVNWFSTDPSEVKSIVNRFTAYFMENVSSFTLEDNNSLTFMGNAPEILVVEHYIFRTNFWEMELSRHNMIAPYDWIQVYLRPRNLLEPTWAGLISSWSSENHTIIEINPPEEIFR